MQSTKKIASVRVLIQALFFVVVMPFLPLLISGQWNWWAGWAYGILGFLSFVISRVLAARKNPDLIAERAKFMQHEDAQSWDKLIIPVIGLMGVVIAVIAGLDRLYHWTVNFSLWVNLSGLFLLIIGYAFSSSALIVNRFFSGMVRLQADRGQQVISTGPYRIVRHPGYAGGILAYLATPILLNSIWILIPIFLTIALFVVRTFLEDRFLQENLAGYREYAERVKFRLIPGIW